ncbi:hypothetical protein SDJN03_13173, partial [Cucurbita argyrosperma subsp. sororia]
MKENGRENKAQTKFHGLFSNPDPNDFFLNFSFPCFQVSTIIHSFSSCVINPPLRIQFVPNVFILPP